MTNAGVNGYAGPAAASPNVSITGRLVSGNYYHTASQWTSTTALFTAGQLRLAPCWIPNAVSLSRIGAEVTTIGDSGSKVRLGIYADNGNGYPGSLVLDAGTIAGDSATVQEIVISQGLGSGLYWFGASSQIVSVTAPTLRVINSGGAFPIMSAGTTIPASNTSYVGYSQSSVTGALPAVFQTTVSTVASATRVFVKVA